MEEEIKIFKITCKNCGKTEEITENRYINIDENLCTDCYVMSDTEYGCGFFDGPERER